MKLIALTVAVLSAAASGVAAKGHDQGGTAVPGAEDVGSVTVTSAHMLGGLRGNRPEGKGPSDANPAAANAGR